MEQAPALLFVVPFVAALLIAVLKPFAPGAARPVAVSAATATAALALWALPRVLVDGTLRVGLGGWPAPLGIELVLDPLAAGMAVLVSLTALGVLASTRPFVEVELPGHHPLFLALALLLVSGLMGMVVTGDLFNLFVHLEVASLSAYALVAAGGRRGAPRSGLRYLLIGSFGASLYLAGVGFLYGATGTLNMEDLSQRMAGADPELVRTGGLLVIVGLAIKMGLYPLHLWMPSAYARGPAASTALMGPLVTKVSAYALLRVLLFTLGLGTVVGQLPLAEIVAWLGAASVLAGGAMALVQDDLRRLFAYSSVGQIGVVALGIGLADVPGVTGAVLHLAADTLVKASLFLAAGTALIHLGVDTVDELRTLRGRAPWTSAAIALSGLSLVGIPPLAGFYGKWYVLNAAVAEERWAFVAALLLGSLASVGYVFRLIERLYFVPAPAQRGAPAHVPGGGPEGAGRWREAPTAAVFATVAFASLSVALGLANALVVSAVVAPSLPGPLLP